MYAFHMIGWSFFNEFFLQNAISYVVFGDELRRYLGSILALK
jgi:hypothetical protein